MNFDLIKNGGEAKKALGDIQVIEFEGESHPASSDDAWTCIGLFRDWRVGDPCLVYRALQLVAPEIRRANARARRQLKLNIA